MAVPRQSDLHRPVLEILSDANGAISHRQIMNAVIDQLNLSNEDQRERTSSGAVRLNTNVSYAELYLKNAGLLNRVARGMWNITTQGRDFLAENPGPISIAQLKELADDTRSRPSNSGRLGVSNAVSQTRDISALGALDVGPDELMENGFRQLQSNLTRQLLENIGDISPERFEALVIDLLVKMGYGTGQAVGGSGDGGIDGVINQDPLGLEKVYLQAKRWAGSGWRTGNPQLLRQPGRQRRIQGSVYHHVQLQRVGATHRRDHIGGQQVYPADWWRGIGPADD